MNHLYHISFLKRYAGKISSWRDTLYLNRMIIKIVNSRLCHIRIRKYTTHFVLKNKRNKKKRKGNRGHHNVPEVGVKWEKFPRKGMDIMWKARKRVR